MNDAYFLNSFIIKSQNLVISFSHLCNNILKIYIKIHFLKNFSFILRYITKKVFYHKQQLTLKEIDIISIKKGGSFLPPSNCIIKIKLIKLLLSITVITEAQTEVTDWLEQA